jgi:hypothetical protein
MEETVQHRHRQERWLHARISETLEDALKREARRRRQPVSLLVRNVLEGALDLVEDIVESSLGVATRSEHLARHLHRPQPDGSREDAGGLDDVYGWQEIILNRAASCARCETGLAGGAHAFRGLRDDAGPAVFLCPACIRRLRQPATHEEGSR